MKVMCQENDVAQVAGNCKTLLLAKFEFTRVERNDYTSPNFITQRHAYATSDPEVQGIIKKCLSLGAASSYRTLVPDQWQRTVPQ